MNLYNGVLEVALLSPLLVGGQSPPPAGLDAATARRDALPLLPASALKGALREAVLRRAQTEGQVVCGGWQTPSPQALPCGERAPDDRCVVCRIFGPIGASNPTLDGQAREPANGGGWGQAGLRLSDARPAQAPDQSADAFTRRFGVAIDRWSGRAAEARLYHREAAEAGAVLVAPLRARLSGADFQYLEECLALVEGIGNSRTRGLGQVALRFVPDEERPMGGFALKTEAPEGLVLLRAVEPLHFGGVPTPDSVASTLDHVPGAALRAAVIGAAWRASVPQVELDHLVQSLQFSDLWPCARNALSYPSPRLALTCKSCKSVYFPVLQEAAAQRALQQGFVPDDVDLAALLPPSVCPTCGEAHPGSLKPLGGVLEAGAEAPALRKRLVTRLAHDFWAQGAAHGQLYAREQIEPGACFSGSVAGLDARARAALAALQEAGEPVLVGAMRNRGLGAVQVQILDWTEDARARLGSWQAEIHAARAPDAPLAEGLVLVSARTDLLPEPGVSAADQIGRALFGAEAGSFTVLGRWERTALRCGWNDLKRPDHPVGPRKVKRPVRAGSCWLFQVLCPIDPDRLRAAETAGVGQDRELGLGRLMIAPPVPTSLTTPPAALESPMPSVRAETARRAIALFSAEGDTAFRDALVPLNPTALRNLSQAAEAAEVSEELEILIPYQAARGYLNAQVADGLLTAIRAIKNDFGGEDGGMEAIRAFLGHLIRLHRAAQPTREED